MPLVPKIPYFWGRLELQLVNAPWGIALKWKSHGFFLPHRERRNLSYRAGNAELTLCPRLSLLSFPSSNVEVQIAEAYSSCANALRAVNLHGKVVLLSIQYQRSPLL